MTKHWYVYHLVDPRDRKVFYVGKGTGSRVRDHEGEARRGVTSEKCNKIREIWDDDLPVERRVVEIFTDEEAALRAEAKEIARIGLHQLTNRCEGWLGKWEFSAEVVRVIALIAHVSEGFKYELDLAIPAEASTLLGTIWRSANLVGLVKVARGMVAAAVNQFGFAYVNEKFKKHNVTFSAP